MASGPAAEEGGIAKLKTPPSLATSQQPLPSGVATMATIGSALRLPERPQTTGTFVLSSKEQRRSAVN